jgi:ParB family chromosome partitioning protein
VATKLNAGDVDRRDLFFIPPEEISACQEQNGRWQPHDEAAVEEMVASYEQCGQLQPVIVRRIENNRVALVLGFRRWLAALQWNRFHPDKPMKLKCVLSALNDEEALSRNVIENRERKSTSPVDDAHNARRLTENYGWTDARVAELFRVSASYLSQLKKLLTLPTDVQKRVHSGELSVATAVSLAALPKDEQAEVLKQIEPQPVTALEQVDRYRLAAEHGTRGAACTATRGS